MDNIRIVGDAPVDVDEPRKEQQLQIYPNPASDYIHVESGAIAPVNIELLTTSGQLIATRKMARRSSVYVADFTPGPYLIRSQMPSGETQVAAFVKK